jgi:hypothetical protein
VTIDAVSVPSQSACSTDDDRPCLTKAADNDSIGLGWSSGAPKNRTGRGGFPSNVEKILDGDDLAIERAQRDSGLATAVSSVSRCPCRVRIELEEDAMLVTSGCGREDGFEAITGRTHVPLRGANAHNDTV